MPKRSGSQKRKKEKNKETPIKLTKQSFIKRGKKGIIKEEQEFNKGLELEKQWRTKRWTKIKDPIKKPKEKWSTKIRLIITLQEHQINSAIIKPNKGKIERRKEGIRIRSNSNKIINEGEIINQRNQREKRVKKNSIQAAFK